MRPTGRRTARRTRRIAASGRRVAAVSTEIIERIAPTGPHEVVPNGVEPAEWLQPLPAEPSVARRGFPARGPSTSARSTAGSTCEGIADAGRAAPTTCRSCCSARCPTASYIASLAHIPNVHVHGSVGRAELVATLRNADLCLVAHRRTPLTEAMSPLKLYEYLAAGMPVIATDLPPVRGIDERVLLADTVGDFADVVPMALALDRADERRRTAFIEANSWAARHGQVLALARS